MIESSSRPGFAMFGRIRIRIGWPIAELIIKIYVTVASIGIQAGVDNDHRVLKPCLCLLVVGIGQFIERPHGGFERTGFVSMNIIAQPDNSRLVFRNSPLFKSGPPQIIQADGLQVLKFAGEVMAT